MSLLVRLICNFGSKQSREAVDLPLTCHPPPSLTTFALRSREVGHLLLDFDPYGGTDPFGMFTLFLKRTAGVMAPRLSVVTVVFQRLVHQGSFPPCWSIGQCHPNSEKFTVHLCWQLATGFHNISIV